MFMTKKQFLNQLEAQLEAGIADAGSYDPAIMDEVRELRKQIKRITLAQVRKAIALSHLNWPLNRAWEAYLEAENQPEATKNILRRRLNLATTNNSNN